MNGPAFFSYIGQGIIATISRVNPVLSVVSQRVFFVFATIVLMIEGYKYWFSGRYGDRAQQLARTLVQIAIGFTMVTCYETPIPFLGISFTNLVTDTTGYFATVLDAQSVMQTYGMFQTMQERF